eukprot:TRINITY_DN2978_c0_g1_i2.p2 TRINITY_DN2978_c0_g1~~TRINITY_DN2978_c0_g1_i2.p2  ORF type:complete len:169 (+),score=40.17 TRINITY_DN2978_c0_g1_i2:29-535(+)
MFSVLMFVRLQVSALFFFFLMIRRPPRSTQGVSSAASDVYKRQVSTQSTWEKSKAFDESAPIGDFIPYDRGLMDLANIEFSCRIDGELKQQGNTANMIFSVHTLIMELSKVWKLMPGDIIYTGTPEGIGPIKRGQIISIYGLGMEHSWKIVQLCFLMEWASSSTKGST